MKNQKIFKNYIDGYISLTAFIKNLFINYGYQRDKIYIKDNGFVELGLNVVSIGPPSQYNYVISC